MMTHVPMIEAIVMLPCKETSEKSGYDPRLYPNWYLPDMASYCKHVGIPVNYEMVCAAQLEAIPIEVKGTDKRNILGGAVTGYQCLSEACYSTPTSQAKLQKYAGHVVRCVAFTLRTKPAFDPSLGFGHTDPE
eukprot:452241-Prymnesium_polylepis.1